MKDNILQDFDEKDAFPDYYVLFDCGECPNCGGERTFIEKTAKPIRRKYCSECNAEWSTITVNLWHPEALRKAAELSEQKARLEAAYPFL